jgi:hypothetical protein
MTRFEFYAVVVALLLPALGCSAKPSYQISADRADFNKSCTKKLKVHVTDARQLGEFYYYSDRGIGGTPEPGAIGMRDYFTYGIWMVKFKNDPQLYRPFYPGTSVYSSGERYANTKDSYFNSSPEQCEREFPVHPDIERYVFVLCGHGKAGDDPVGWRVIELSPAQNNDTLYIGDLEKGMPFAEHPQSRVLLQELQTQLQRAHPSLALPN